jgi:flagellar basal-body rod modification protein FlgD
MVNSVGSSAAIGQAATTAQKTSLGQSDFLKLMVSQMQNQDPTNPSSSGDFLSQMAQFSTNDSINKMQASIQQLVGSLQSNQALGASALVGRKVMVNSNSLNLGTEGDAKASVKMVNGLTNLTASVYAANGALVKTIPIGTPAAGNYEFSWDGTNDQGERAASGAYTLKVNANYGGQTGALQTMVQANVDSVSLGQNGDGLKLNVAGIGPVSLSDVQQISV